MKFMVSCSIEQDRWLPSAAVAKSIVADHGA